MIYHNGLPVYNISYSNSIASITGKSPKIVYFNNNCIWCNNSITITVACTDHSNFGWPFSAEWNKIQVTIYFTLSNTVPFNTTIKFYGHIYVNGSGDYDMFPDRSVIISSGSSSASVSYWSSGNLPLIEGLSRYGSNSSYAVDFTLQYINCNNYQTTINSSCATGASSSDKSLVSATYYG